MTFTEFVDATLVLLYEADKQQPSRTFSLDVLARELKDGRPPGWVFDAAKVSESRGLARCMYTFGGTFAGLTGEGRLYVEEQRGSIRKLNENRTTYFNVSGGQVQIINSSATGDISFNAGADRETSQLIKEMRRVLDDDRSINAARRDEARDYLKYVELEFAKPEPNRTVITAFLEPLSRIASIGNFALQLARMMTEAVS